MNNIHKFYTGKTTFLCGEKSGYVKPQHEHVIKELFPKAHIIYIKGIIFLQDSKPVFLVKVAQPVTKISLKTKSRSKNGPNSSRDKIWNQDYACRQFVGCVTSFKKGGGAARVPKFQPDKNRPMTPLDGKGFRTKIYGSNSFNIEPHIEVLRGQTFFCSYLCGTIDTFFCSPNPTFLYRCWSLGSF